MSGWKYQDAVRESDVGPASVRMVLWVIASHSDANGIAIPGIPLICAESGLSRSTVLRALSALYEDNLVRRAHRKRGNKSTTSNMYRINLEGLQARARPSRSAELKSFEQQWALLTGETLLDPFDGHAIQPPAGDPDDPGPGDPPPSSIPDDPAMFSQVNVGCHGDTPPVSSGNSERVDTPVDNSESRSDRGVTETPPGVSGRHGEGANPTPLEPSLEPPQERRGGPVRTEAPPARAHARTRENLPPARLGPSTSTAGASRPVAGEDCRMCKKSPSGRGWVRVDRYGTPLPIVAGVEQTRSCDHTTPLDDVEREIAYVESGMGTSRGTSTTPRTRQRAVDSISSTEGHRGSTQRDPKRSGEPMHTGAPHE